MYGHEPSFRVGIFPRLFRVASRVLIDIGNLPLDRRKHVNRLAVAENGPNLLALTYPLASLRQHNSIDLSHQFGRKLIHAYAHQSRAFAQRPRVTGMIAKMLRNSKTTDHRRRQPE